MLLKIREKSQGAFAWIILILICVPFALWGIQNYVGGGSQIAIAKVGDREFFQQDVNQAYAQYSQSLAGKKFDEKIVKQQALEKLISDEVLLQHAENIGLVIADNAARDFIKNLDYFQSEGIFDKQRFKSMLSSQGISQKDFVGRIKKALVMEQFQRSVTESAFATTKDIENFFRIHNQTRDVEIISIGLQPVKTLPSQEEIGAYYQANQNRYLTDEQVSIEYVQLSLDDLAKKINPTDEQLGAYFEERKAIYTTKERRKISHILFSFSDDSDDDEKQLRNAIKAKRALQDKDFSELAKELSDDKITAMNGGDLGLFNVGVMEKAFEDAVNALQLGEVSEPVKSAFGYHLIKVTELVPRKVKAFATVKAELTIAYQRQEAENSFYELGEALAQVSYENPNNLTASAELLGVKIEKTGFFGAKQHVNTTHKQAISSNNKVIEVAFSEDVLTGNNSEPIELSPDKLIVLRVLEYKPANVKPLNEVTDSIVLTLHNQKAQAVAFEKMTLIKKAIANGQTMQAVAEKNNLEVQYFPELTRSNGELPWVINRDIFKAAKPSSEKSTVVSVSGPSGSQTIINLLAVTEGVMSESDKARQELAEENLAKAFGQAEFNATLNSLQGSTSITFNTTE